LLAHELSFTGYECTRAGKQVHFIAIMVVYSQDQGYGFINGPFRGVIMMSIDEINPKLFKIDLVPIKSFNQWLARTAAKVVFKPNTNKLIKYFPSRKDRDVVGNPARTN
jgi:hypothetical protein